MRTRAKTGDAVLPSDMRKAWACSPATPTAACTAMYPCTRKPQGRKGLCSLWTRTVVSGDALLRHKVHVIAPGQRSRQLACLGSVHACA